MNLVLVHEYLRCPFGYDLQHPIHINDQLCQLFGASQYLRVIVILELLKYDEKLRCEFIQGVEECVHELFGHFVCILKQLFTDSLKEIFRIGVFDAFYMSHQADFLKATSLAEAEEILTDQHQVTFIKGLEQKWDES